MSWRHTEHMLVLRGSVCGGQGELVLHHFGPSDSDGVPRCYVQGALHAD